MIRIALPGDRRIDIHDFGNGLADLTSNLQEEADDEGYRAAVDAVESLVLAQHCAGLDVTAPAYVAALTTTLEAIANQH